jgi:hypothetical protein
MLFKKLPDEYNTLRKEYEISRCGQVRSVDKTTLQKRLLSQKKYNGYMKAQVGGKQCLIHYLVAISFVPKPEDYDSTFTIDHIDHNDRLNNHASNLRWASTSTQTKNQRKKIRYQIDSLPVIATSLDGIVVRKFNSLREANTTIVGSDIRHISGCINGKRKQHMGYTWKTPESDPDIEGETWKLFNVVKQYKVCVSDHGRVSFNFNNGYIKKISSFDKNTTRATEDYNKYPKLSKNGQTFYLHVVVWELFMGEKPANMVINHIDHNKQNASLSNLELVTQSDNMKFFRIFKSI